MARPKKAPHERRDDVLGVRLTAAEHAALQRHATALGISAGEFMRRRALGYRLPPLNAEQKAMTSMAAALMPIGVNLNQLARAANAGRLLPASVTELAGRIASILEGLYGPGADERRKQL